LRGVPLFLLGTTNEMMSFPNVPIGNPGLSFALAHSRCSPRSGSPLKTCLHAEVRRFGTQACGDDRSSHFAKNARNDSLLWFIVSSEALPARPPTSEGLRAGPPRETL